MVRLCLIEPTNDAKLGSGELQDPQPNSRAAFRGTELRKTSLEWGRADGRLRMNPRRVASSAIMNTKELSLE